MNKQHKKIKIKKIKQIIFEKVSMLIIFFSKKKRCEGDSNPRSNAIEPGSIPFDHLGTTSTILIQFSKKILFLYLFSR